MSMSYFQEKQPLSSRQACSYVRAASVSVERLFPHELQAVLDEYLRQPYMALSPFALMDRIERQSAAGSVRVSAQTLAAFAAPRLLVQPEQIGQVLARAIRRGLVEGDALTGFSLTQRGRAKVREGRHARLALMRLHAAPGPSWACAAYASGLRDCEEREDEDLGLDEEDEDDAQGSLPPQDNPFDPGNRLNPFGPLEMAAGASQA